MTDSFISHIRKNDKGTCVFQSKEPTLLRGFSTIKDGNSTAYSLVAKSVAISIFDDAKINIFYETDK